MNKNPCCLLLCLLVVISMMLSACQSVATPTSSEAEAPAKETEAPAPNSEPVYMTINVEQVSTWMRNFNPFSPDVRYPAHTGMYEPLMNYNKNTGELVPWLATGYAWNEDNTMLTFKIRQGVKWSDGEPFSAKDVLFTFNLLKNNPALATTATTILSDFVDSVSTPDDFTVEIKFKKVYTLALLRFGQPVHRSRTYLERCRRSCHFHQ